MALQLYFNPLSQPSRAVETLLILGKVNYQPHVLDLMKKEQFSEEYSKISPTNNVPAIVDGDFKLFESHSILRYIARKYKLTQFYPEDLQQAAKIDTYLDWHHFGTRKCANVARDLVFFPIMFGKPIPEDKDEQLKALGESLTFFEKVFLDNGNQKYIYGNNDITLADVSAICELTTLFTLDFDFSKHQVTYKYMELLLSNADINKAHQAYFGFLKAKFENLNESIKKLIQ